ncbi:TPA: hypothetical protein RI751_003603 [Vibrio cholerae]|uniref:hypothetical protein n=1 Tax=Vibrio cholerae TaxID=666 RepID=UPI0012EBDE39|nr:hypothetical protein [Vibrio cholerae]MVB72651.1 hypothetical protein [Vibrio cholerae]MVC02450.1 hypothetical protein [Vibrio cholerae]HAS3528776.1 hypothetical protein [Vibrio cholerae]HAS4517442.1 hypothetical protein [Vibrio cholerae]
MPENKRSNSPNKNFIYNPSNATIKRCLSFVFDQFGFDRDMVQISSFFMFPTNKPKNISQSKFLNKIQQSEERFSNYATMSLMFVVYNTLVNSGYMEKRDNVYYLTDQGYKAAFKSKHPIRYLFKFHWKVVIPVLFSALILAIELKYN